MYYDILIKDVSLPSIFYILQGDIALIKFIPYYGDWGIIWPTRQLIHFPSEPAYIKGMYHNQLIYERIV